MDCIISAIGIIWALCEKNAINENFDVVECSSVEKVKAQFQLRLKNTNTTKRLAVVVDADTDLRSRWQQYKDILLKSGKYIVPVDLPTEGLILQPIDPDNLTVGIWVMPNNTLNGMIEDFVLDLTIREDALLKKTDEVLNEIEVEAINRYKPVHKAKARIHTWLAWQENPGTPMGQAITKMYLTTETAACQQFIGWLNKMFS